MPLGAALEKAKRQKNKINSRVLEFLLWCNGIAAPGCRLNPHQHSGLKDPPQHCWSRGVGQNCSSDLTPGLGTPYAAGRPKKRKKEKKCFLILSWRKNMTSISQRLRGGCFSVWCWSLKSAGRQLERQDVQKKGEARRSWNIFSKLPLKLTQRTRKPRLESALTSCHFQASNFGDGCWWAGMARELNTSGPGIDELMQSGQRWTCCAVSQMGQQMRDRVLIIPMPATPPRLSK